MLPADCRWIDLDSPITRGWWALERAGPATYRAGIGQAGCRHCVIRIMSTQLVGWKPAGNPVSGCWLVLPRRCDTTLSISAEYMPLQVPTTRLWPLLCMMQVACELS